MAGWSAPERLIRDDDPYHAWAYLVAADATPGGLCPVVLEVVSAEESITALRDALVDFATHLVGMDAEGWIDPNQSWPFRMTAFDQAHLVHSLRAMNRLVDELQGDDSVTWSEVLDRTAYARMYLAYAPEAAVFVDQRPLYWDASGFDILFVGRTIRDEAAKSTLRSVPGADERRPFAMISVIDDSLAFLNAEFTTLGPSGRRESRFSEIWFQDKERPVPGGLTAGALIDKEAIDGQIDRVRTVGEANLYKERIYGMGGMSEVTPLDEMSPDHQPLAFPVSHGTHVASTALRSFDRHSGGRDLALYGVTVPTFVTQDTSGSSMPSYMIAAIRQSMLWNDQLVSASASNVMATKAPRAAVPLVMTCSYGVAAGPKDGTGRLEGAIRKLIDARNRIGRPTALVVPMGNSVKDRTIVHQTVPPGGDLSLDWIVAPDDGTPSFMELFLRPDAGDLGRIDLELAPPGAAVPTYRGAVGDIAPGHAQILRSDQGVAASVSAWPTGPGGHWTARHVLAIGPTRGDGRVAEVPHGRWRLRIRNRSDQPVEISAMIQRDDAPGTYRITARQSYFASDHYDTETGAYKKDGPVTGKGTATTYAAIDSPFVVAAGAGMRNLSGQPGYGAVAPSPYTAAGPRFAGRTARTDPDYTALVDRSDHALGTYAAGTYSGPDKRMSGTSVAVPLVAGYLAAHPDRIGADDGSKAETTDGDRLGEIIGAADVEKELT